MSAIRQAWEVERKHGAEHWQRVCDEQIGDLRGRVPKDIRKAIVKELTKDHISNRDLAAAFGVSHVIIGRDRGGNKVTTKQSMETPTEVNAELDGIAKATHDAELETWKTRAIEAEKRSAELSRVDSQGENNLIVWFSVGLKWILLPQVRRLCPVICSTIAWKYSYIMRCSDLSHSF